MIKCCPVCAHQVQQSVVSYEEVPIFQLVRLDESPASEHFAPFSLVRCVGCGHLYNLAYQEELADRMYTGEFLSNVPVHFSMSQALKQIADWIGPEQYAGKRVIEVGGGSGHLSRLLSREARSVVVFEPSRGLRADMITETNLTLINEPFTALASVELADLIVCRHVLEHVANPLGMLQALRAALMDDGCFYLEVPRAEYIEEQAALYDLHIAHVQYFYQRNLLDLAEKAGFELDRHWLLKQNHDLGLLLRPRPSRSNDPGLPPKTAISDLNSALHRRRSRDQAALARLTGTLGLYGANWHATAFLNAHQTIRRINMAFDDNPEYAGSALYSREQIVPVQLPTKSGLAEIDTVLIIAYLHDRVISDRLRKIGFSGQILTIASEPSEGEYSHFNAPSTKVA